MITVHVFCLSFTNIYLLIDIVQLPIQVSILRLRWKPIRLSLKQILSSFCKIVRQEKPVEKQDSSSWFGFKKETKEVKETKPNPGGEFDGLWVYLFPSNGINCYSPAWYSIRVLPITAKRTILQYDIYTKKGLDDEEKKEFVDFYSKLSWKILTCVN